MCQAMLIMRRSGNLKDLDGVLLLDKPAGPSSNQAMQRARRVLAARKAGHAGTLDPLATGLLPILLGEATKFAGALSDDFKIYEATLWFGVTTATGDLDGEILTRQAVDVSAEQVRAAIEQFRGEISQVPPMYSALKVNGRPLYERARRGETIERAPRRVNVTELSVTALRADECDIRVRCSKGTYIRVLAEDLGLALGCGATLKRLRRTAVGPFDVASAVSLEELEARGGQWDAQLLLPVDAALTHLPTLCLTQAETARVLNGQAVIARTEPSIARVRLYARETRHFIGLGEVIDGTLHPRRLVAFSPDVGKAHVAREIA
jgi:tRNA pseudouridine55 synthase